MLIYVLKMYPVEIIEILDTSISRLLGPRNTSPFGLAFVSDWRTHTPLYVYWLFNKNVIICQLWWTMKFIQSSNMAWFMFPVHYFTFLQYASTHLVCHELPWYKVKLVIFVLSLFIHFCIAFSFSVLPNIYLIFYELLQ